MSLTSKTKIVISCLTLLLTASLLWFKISINSDSLFLDALATDIFSLGGNWTNWKLTPAPAYFPDMLLYFISYKIFPNAYSRIFFVSALQVIILALTVTWTSKKIYRIMGPEALSATVLSIALITLLAAKSNMWLYFYSTNNHFAALIFSFICLGYLIKYYENPSLFNIIIFILASSIAKASTEIFSITFIIPIIILSLIILFIATHKRSTNIVCLRKLWGVIIATCASCIISSLITLLTVYNNPLEGRAPASIDAAGNSLRIFFQAVKIIFSTDNKLAFLISLLILSSFLFIIYNSLRDLYFNHHGIGLGLALDSQNTSDDNWPLTFSGTLLCISTPISILGAILSGGFIDIFAFRYFSFPIALAITLTILIFDKKGYFSGKLWNWLYFLITAIIIAVSIQFLMLQKSNKSQVPPIATCLIDIQKNGFSLNAGIADYLNARGISEYLPNKNPIFSTSNDLSPFFWMSSIGPILYPLHYPEYDYNFAIIRNSTNQGQFNYTTNTIGKLLPAPTKIYQCTNADAQIWLYKNEDLNKIVTTAFNLYAFEKNFRNSITIVESSLSNNIGAVSRLAQKASHQNNKPGWMTYGPYINLMSGQYTVSVNYSSVIRNGLPVGYIDMGRFSTNNPTLLFTSHIIDATHGVITTTLKVSPTGFKKFETRIRYSGNGMLVINSIKIHKIQE